ncbi:MAG: penicillin acylase family protein [Bacteroidota bacterium]
MPLRAKILIGSLITLAFFSVALVIFFYYLITKSFPTTSGSVDVPGLRASVKIFRDEYGVPHIIAESEEDAYFAVGYVHAQDRLWQMELMRRAGQGRLAEVLGEPALKIDRMFRTLGIWRQALKIAPTIDEKTRTAAQSYADGVSSFIETHKGKYPIEFDLLDIEPEPWRIEHSVMISRLMAWELNYSRWVDITLTELVERFGEAKAAEIFPTWPEGAPVIVPDELRGKKVADLGKQLLQTDQAFRTLMGNDGLETGSNAWVISGSRSATGKPILANDPHLLFSVPGRWYELHVIAPGLDVAGASIAGVPFVVIGRNQHIAWGVTNAMMDDEDFYIEQVDSIQHPTRYRFNNTWRPLEQQVDTILVKDGPPVLLTIYRTHRGPIVNRIEPAAGFSEHLLSMRWVGHEISNEAGAFYRMNRASNWNEFLEGLKYFAVPAQNFVYADDQGTIGYHTGGRIPIRSTKSPTLLFPGWTDQYDWKGFVPFEEMPQMLNPAEGFIATANNRIISDSYPYYISNLWQPHWLVTRITEVLRSQSKFSVEDLQRLQLDVLSPHAREIVPIILSAFETRSVTDPDVQTALNYFRNWNFEMKSNDVPTTLFQAFFVRMVHNTYEDEMGPELMALYDTLATVPMTVTTKLMKKGSSVWFDNIKTPPVESMADILRQSLEDAIHDLKNAYGGELKEWQWGAVHQVEFPHVFSANSLLRKVFNLGPYPVGGSHSTVNKGDYRLKKPFLNHVGPSTRQIFDLSDANNGRAVTPPGQSGQVFQRHYDDQIQLWLNGGYRRMVMNRSSIENSKYDLLLLTPRK